jgi:hypothetical protein
MSVLTIIVTASPARFAALAAASGIGIEPPVEPVAVRAGALNRSGSGTGHNGRPAEVVSLPLRIAAGRR